MRPFVPVSQLIRSQLQDFGGGVVRVGDLVAGTDERTIRRPSHVVFRPFPLVSVREQIESFESVSDPLLNSLNPLPFSPLFLNLGGCWGVDQ
jgi:hypothetical protein